MIFGVVIVFSACLTASLSFDIQQLLEEGTFKRCMEHMCADPSLLEKELECMNALSEKDTEFLRKEAEECYGTPEFKKASQGACEDVVKSYECSKECYEKFKVLDRSDEEKAQLEQYKECIAPLYEPCM